MSFGKPMLLRPLLLLGVAIVLWVAVVPVIPQHVPFRPPFGPEAEPVTLPPLPEPDAHLSPEEYWEQKAAAQVMIHQWRKKLGDVYADGFIQEAGPTGPFEVIILATEERDIPGATFVKVPHSRSDLERVRDWISGQITDRDPPIKASTSLSRRDGLLIVRLCAPPDAPLNLSFLPATAVQYTGECPPPGDDPSSKL